MSLFSSNSEKKSSLIRDASLKAGITKQTLKDMAKLYQTWACSDFFGEGADKYLDAQMYLS
jgi:hypothetical protein